MKTFFHCLYFNFIEVDFYFSNSCNEILFVLFFSDEGNMIVKENHTFF